MSSAWLEAKNKHKNRKKPEVVWRGTNQAIKKRAAGRSGVSTNVNNQRSRAQVSYERTKRQLYQEEKNRQKRNETRIGLESKQKHSRSKPNLGKSMKQMPKFAEGLCFQKLFFIFLIGSVFGTLYEDALSYIESFLSTGVGEVIIHRGVIYGPFNVIYGFGAALMCWLLLRKKYNNWQIFCLAALVGGFVEYSLSFLQETFTGTTSWDYTDLILDINGRTTLPIMAVWGFLGLILVKSVYPVVSDLIEKIPLRMGEALFIALTIFMCVNMLVSWSAIIRRGLRHSNIPAYTPVGEFLDKTYPDSYLEKYFPNMEWATKEKT